MAPGRDPEAGRYIRANRCARLVRPLLRGEAAKDALLLV